MIDTAQFLRGGRTALVLIDLQRGITARDVAPHSAGDVVDRSASLARAFRAAQLPVVFVRVSFGEGNRTMLRPLLDDESPPPLPGPGWDELDERLTVNADDVVVTKRNWGAFYGTDLDLHLRRRDVTRIVLCGISTNFGVESTARDAYERNFNLLFVEDAMAASTPEQHRHSCQVIFPRMGIVRSAQEVIRALS